MDDLRALLQATSRTFAIGIDCLPRGLRDEVTVAYLVLRVSDYLEDNEIMPAAEKEAALLAWAEVLEGSGEPNNLKQQVVLDPALVDSAAMRDVDAVLAGLDRLHPQARDVVVSHSAASTRGMARWIRRGPDFQTEADLDDYMHEVAGRVGYLLTDLFALRFPYIVREPAKIKRLAREFGLGLQTVNVIRGLSTDHKRGWFYLPAEFLPPGVAPEGLLDDPTSATARAVLDHVCDKAGRHLDGALQYVLHLPRHLYGVRVFCLLPLFLALRTLTLSRNNPDVYTREVKVSRPDVAQILTRTRMLWFSNAWIRRFARHLSVRETAGRPAKRASTSDVASLGR